jgi:parallel beta-helix repeat protein
MSDASSYGLWLSDRSKNNVISNNIIERCYYGIYLGYSRHNVLSNNTVISQYTPPPFVYGVNFAVVGAVLEDFTNDVDDSNTVDGKSVFYWVNRQNAEVPPNAGYVALINCTGITVQNQNLTKNKHGVLLAWTTGSTVRENTMYYNADGIYLFHSSGNIIAQQCSQ